MGSSAVEWRPAKTREEGRGCAVCPYWEEELNSVEEGPGCGGPDGGGAAYRYWKGRGCDGPDGGGAAYPYPEKVLKSVEWSAAPAYAEEEARRPSLAL